MEYYIRWLSEVRGLQETSPSPKSAVGRLSLEILGPTTLVLDPHVDERPQPALNGERTTVDRIGYLVQIRAPVSNEECTDGKILFRCSLNKKRREREKGDICTYDIQQ